MKAPLLSDASAPSADFTIRRAAPADAATLAALMASTFRETWAPHYAPADLAAYLTEHYSPAQQRAQLTDPASTILLAEATADGAAIGFARLHSGPPPDYVAQFGPAPAIELGSLYVFADWHDRRVGAALFDAALSLVEAAGYQTLWLGVWPDNHRALRFYYARGFVQVGTHPFAVGQQVDEDLLLARAVGAGTETLQPSQG